MYTDISFAVVIVLLTGLYFNVGYAYIKYMNDHDSSYSRLRRFLAGGWNLYGETLEKGMNEKMSMFHYTSWISLLVITMFLWILWLGWEVIYFTFGGLAKDSLEKQNDK